ncbi:MAG: stage II sporulation protein D [Peptococcaceae bacterium]|nr:stage II sporulation protein D [Peptococcaceae bacterium]
MKRLILAAFILTAAAVLGIPAAVNRLGPARIEKAGTVVHMYSHAEGKIINLSVEDYVIGVVAAEMPAEFPDEALKAQAVAARTYIMRRLTAGGVANPVHPGADVCDDHRHYQAWISGEEMKKRWGAIGFYRYYFKIARSVYSTRHQVMTHAGQLIDPVYHSSCGGLGTVSAGEVWKFDIPYLKGVPCPYCADPEPVREVFFTLAEFKKAAGEDISALPASAGGKGFFEVIERTSGGQPKTVRIGSKILPAATAREMLGLRSARFDLTLDGERVKATTTGYGHGVGMCQYGAKGMALKGKNYQEILKHYYTGIEIHSMEN